MQNLLYDFSQTTIPLDHVDRDFLERPKRWESFDIKRFMIFFGPISTSFDILIFLLMWYIYQCNTPANQSLSQTA